MAYKSHLSAWDGQPIVPRMENNGQLAPLWDQMQKISGRAFHLSKLVDIKPITGKEGPYVNQCLVLQTSNADARHAGKPFTSQERNSAQFKKRLGGR